MLALSWVMWVASAYDAEVAEKCFVSQLLTLMDGLTKTSRVVVLATSNRSGVIEPVLRRPGWFNRKLDMGVPVEQGLINILHIKTLQQLCMEAALQCI